MGQASKIEWTDATWNPVRGCSRVSEGCRNCYAERMAARFAGSAGHALQRFDHFHGFAVMTESGPRWTGKVELVESKLSDPLNWRKPRRVFVNSMSDLFHENLPDAAIDRVFAVMALCHQHTFQVLTKRAGRMREYLSGGQRHTPIIDAMNALGVVPEKVAAIRWPLPNVWLGVSVEDQETANERIPFLLNTPAAIRFVSYEPALGPVDFRNIVFRVCPDDAPLQPLLGNIDEYDALRGERIAGRLGFKCNRLDWIIAGGESGPGSRPMKAKWARSVRDQCQSSGVAFFFKQWGCWLPAMEDGGLTKADGQVLNCSNEPQLVGKKAAGRLLDGREWNEFPKVAA